MSPQSTDSSSTLLVLCFLYVWCCNCCCWLFFVFLNNNQQINPRNISVQQQQQKNYVYRLTLCLSFGAAKVGQRTIGRVELFVDDLCCLLLFLQLLFGYFEDDLWLLVNTAFRCCCPIATGALCRLNQASRQNEQQESCCQINCQLRYHFILNWNWRKFGIKYNL